MQPPLHQGRRACDGAAKAAPPACIFNKFHPINTMPCCLFGLPYCSYPYTKADELAMELQKLHYLLQHSTTSHPSEVMLKWYYALLCYTVCRTAATPTPRQMNL
jgi:hypothetical protein